MAKTERDIWVDQMARLLTDSLGEDAVQAGSYSEEECRHLAEFLHDLPLETQHPALAPDEMLRQELLRMQGVDPAVSAIMAQALRHIDLNRILYAPRVVAKLLETSSPTLGQHRASGRFPADIDDQQKPASKHLAYDLARVLRVLSTDRHRTMRIGKGAPRFLEDRP